MRILTLCLAACLLISHACKNETSNKYGETLEEKQRLLEEKKRELQDKSKLDEIDRELKQIENELKRKNGGETSTSAPAPAVRSAQPTGTVTGDGVTMRSGPSTQDSKLGAFTKGETVTLLETRSVAASNEAIAKQQIVVDGNTFPKGKALTIQSSNDGAGTYYVSADNNGVTVYGTVDKNNVEVLGATSWHRVKTGSGAEGWIIGKFLKIN
jgi:hypothetical protein